MLRLLGFLVLLLALVLYLFRHTEINKDIHSQSLGTQKKNASIPSNQSDIDIPPLKVNTDSTFNVEDNHLVETDQSEINDLDYISTYRDWQYFENCYTDIEDFALNKDPLDTLKERFINNTRESQSEPTIQQNIYYQHHVDICKGLINEVANDGDDYWQVINKLEQRFESVLPKTDEEKQLEESLALRKQLEFLKHKYTQAYKRKSNLPIEQQDQIVIQIEHLSQNMMAIYDNSQVLTPEQIITIKDLSDQIESLQQMLLDSKVFDLQLITTIQQEINEHLNGLDDFLRHTKSPDAFLIIASELFRPETLQKESKIMQETKAKTKIHDNYYLQILNNIVHPLIACSMNYPCDPESDFVLSYCLGLKDSMFNQACGQGLEDFYFNFYIGPNQLQDVNIYFNYLVNRYEN